MKRIIIIGASSGLGKFLAEKYIEKGYIIGIAARREEELKALKSINPERVFYTVMDTREKSSKEKLVSLIEKTGGMDVFIYSSGYGKINPSLDYEIEENTIGVNINGFTLLINYAYKFFQSKGGGQIVNISSVAATRDIGFSASYGSTKKFQLMYFNCLRKLARQNNFPLVVTSIQPGFIQTDFIEKDNYPLISSLEKGGNLIFRAIENKKSRAYIPGFWRIIALVWLGIPNFIWRRMI